MKMLHLLESFSGRPKVRYARRWDLRELSPSTLASLLSFRWSHVLTINHVCEVPKEFLRMYRRDIEVNTVETGIP